MRRSVATGNSRGGRVNAAPKLFPTPHPPPLARLRFLARNEEQTPRRTARSRQHTKVRDTLATAFHRASSGETPLLHPLPTPPPLSRPCNLLRALIIFLFHFSSLANVRKVYPSPSSLMPPPQPLSAPPPCSPPPPSPWPPRRAHSDAARFALTELFLPAFSSP